jgi:hypothetical protein
MVVLTSTPNGTELTASKPKERQFQVVPVPGTFTRGRWECWDYRDSHAPDTMILEFADKSANNETHNTVPIINNHGVVNGNAINGTVPVAPMAATMGGADVVVVPVPKESSTIVVTSIAPAPVTPSKDYTDSEVSTSVPLPSANSTNASEATPTITTETTTTFSSDNPSNSVTRVTQISAADHSHLQQQMNTTPLSSRTPTNNNNDETDSTVTASTAAAGATVVAIDNKIEQAMDLVKTHLTFAVISQKLINHTFFCAG